ncbi:MAG: translation initiation factor IF-2, partial [SAR324 cluster bacterium]|nr:translation initiation factor IF-2 [SAR324 cluster bacterium]
RKRQKEVIEPEVTKHVFNPRKKNVKVGNNIVVSEFAGIIGIKVQEIIKKLFLMGIPATINQSIPGETAALIATEFNIDVEVETFNLEDALEDPSQENLVECPRAPIVTVMGHVDHGKTSLLDKIRSSRVTLGEAGGITQHIGAYHVATEVGNITFLDTPGHEAFTAMRARGANVTDIVILVVAADDGVQPQTIEAIHHAQAAEVPIIVAVNKIDRPQANPARIRQELLEHGLIAEELGGETIFVHVSAKSGEGMDHLLEMIQIQAEVLELKAPIDGDARGIIVESKVSKGRGPVGTVLVTSGTLKVGDYFVVGQTFGRIRAMFNDQGKSLKNAVPAIPVEIVGFNEVPEIGEKFFVLADEKRTRQIAEERAKKTKESVAVQQQKMHLDTLFSKIGADAHVELKILIKADVQGSSEALQSSLKQLGNEHVSVRFIHSAVGSITETDVVLAAASDAIIIGFNVRPDSKAREVIAREGVDVRLYSIIYDAIDEIKAALEGLLKPIIREEVIGHCVVRKVYTLAKQNIILGCYVTDGKVIRGAHARLIRNNIILHDGAINSLRRFKDEVKEVLNNYECGMTFSYEDVKEEDTFEIYQKVEEAAKL